MITKIITEESAVDLTGGAYTGHRRHCLFYGLSGDEKPVTGVENGDVFCEMDTGNLFLFDKSAPAWLEQ